MADEKDDIRRYRNGEMTGAERNALEKKALNDPFLADAIEGAETVDINEFSGDVNELSQKIRKSKRTIWLTPLRIAAGIFVVVGAG